jgi:hypothetical protein
MASANALEKFPGRTLTVNDFCHSVSCEEILQFISSGVTRRA